MVDRDEKLQEWAQLVLQIDQFEKEVTDHYNGEMPQWMQNVRKELGIDDDQNQREALSAFDGQPK